MSTKTTISKKTPKYLQPVEKTEYRIVTSLRKKPYILEKRKKFSIGRLVKNDIRLDMKTVSDVHATIKWVKNNFVITDEKSTNGVYLNGSRIKDSAKLSDGDKIKIARYVLNFQVKKERQKKTK
ncbi:MAG: FHA domain-containing protein [Spirochaetales bacterium]|nr:FHA domain-containing protein [Spirochaetales bacterium]